LNLYFVIDTDEYAGSFERELCAHITGQVGECEVGEENARRFEKAVDETIQKRMEVLIGLETDEDGCSRPVKLISTPGWFNNGHGGHFSEDAPGVEALALASRDQAIIDYANKTIRRVYEDKNYGSKKADGYIEKYLREPLTRHPAYQSVAICLNERPTNEEIDFMKSRAHSYDGLSRLSSLPGFKQGKAPFNIIGFRIVEEKVVEAYENV